MRDGGHRPLMRAGPKISSRKYCHIAGVENRPAPTVEMLLTTPSSNILRFVQKQQTGQSLYMKKVCSVCIILELSEIVSIQDYHPCTSGVLRTPQSDWTTKFSLGAHSSHFLQRDAILANAIVSRTFEYRTYWPDYKLIAHLYR